MSAPTPERCVTCSDEALPATVLSLDGVGALVALPDGTQATVAVDLVPHVALGDVLLCHAGIALGVLAPSSEGA